MGTKCKRAFIIVLDGAGNSIKDTDTPNIHGLFSKGFLTYEAQASYPSISAECYGSLFHGVDPEKHGLTNDIASSKPYPDDSPYPSFMKLARNKWPDADLASFCCWSPINSGIVEQSIHCHFGSKPDGQLVEEVAQYIETHDPKAVFVALDAPDGAGHNDGYWSEDYFKQVTASDGHVGVILDAIERAGYMEDSLIIICADHGGGGAHPRSHGSDQPKDMNIFWGCYAPNLLDAQNVTDRISLKDTAAVVAYALGLPIHQNWDGRVPKGLFKK